jgi:hypothetical protein
MLAETNKHMSSEPSYMIMCYLEGSLNGISFAVSISHCSQVPSSAQHTTPADVLRCSPPDVKTMKPRIREIVK